jgi:dTDP-4-dehydrorhamnose reductase
MVKNNRKVLIIGASGYLGSEVVNQTPDDFELYLGYRSEPIKDIKYTQVKIDLLDNDSLQRGLEEISPDIVIHVARIGEFDKNPDRAKEVTTEIATLAKMKKARLIYMSSDAVFDGENGNYKESDKANPITDYGKAKLAAESVIKSELSKYVIVRAGYIYGKGKSGFDNRTKKLMDETGGGNTVKRFKDMYRTPIHVSKLAKSIWKLANSDFNGIIHIGEEKKSVFQFCQDLLIDSGLNPGLVVKDSLEKRDLNIAQDTSLDTELFRNVVI